VALRQAQRQRAPQAHDAPRGDQGGAAGGCLAVNACARVSVAEVCRRSGLGHPAPQDPRARVVLCLRASLSVVAERRHTIAELLAELLATAHHQTFLAGSNDCTMQLHSH